MAQSPPFSRLPNASVESAVADLYDKLNVLAQSQAQQDASVRASVIQTVAAATASSSGSSSDSSSGGGSSVTILPKVIMLPAPTASVDGEVVDYGGSVWRFDASLGTWIELTAAPAVLEDTHANRLANYPAANYDIGTLFIESDRTATYANELVIATPTWVYIGGVMQSTSSSLADLPSDLGTADKGFEFRSSFFFRVWAWSGTAWHYNDGGIGAGAQVSTSGGAPSGGLWQACDGSTVSCALDNATVGNLTASDTRVVSGDNPMIQGGTGGTPQVPTRPTFSGDATVLVANDADSGVLVDVGTTTLAALNPHSHGASLTAAEFNSVITTPTESNGGLPLRVSMAWYMRR